MRKNHVTLALSMGVVVCQMMAASLSAGEQLVVGVGDICPLQEPELMALGTNYIHAIRKAGGIPFLIARSTDAKDIGAALDHVDVLLIAGGPNINPARYNEPFTPQMGETNFDRDAFEWVLMAEAGKRQMPVFGICHGCQLLNVYHGGTLHQDIPYDYPDSKVCHRGFKDGKRHPVSHEVIAVPGSKVAQWGGERFDAPSSHHQSVKAVAPGFRVTARAADGVIEAIESENAIGVQFHPEKLIEPRFVEFSQKMFEGIMAWYAERLSVVRARNRQDR